MILPNSKEKQPETGRIGTQRDASLAKPPIFIFGCARSGTSLLSSMLNAHPDIVCPRETAFFLLLERFADKGAGGASRFWSYYKSHERFTLQGIDESLVDEYLRHIPNPDYKHVLDGVMNAVLKSANKSRWCEKTPGHERFHRQIAEYYPESPILFLIRDPRAVCLSLKNVHWGNESPYVQAKRWNMSARILEKISSAKNVHFIKYESLVENADEELRKICDFIGEEFDQCMIDDRANAFAKDRAESWKSHENEKDVLGAVYKSSVHKWKDELDESEIRKIEVCCARMMELFDYEQVTTASPPTKVTLKILLTCGYFFKACGKKLQSAWNNLSRKSSSA